MITRICIGHASLLSDIELQSFSLSFPLSLVKTTQMSNYRLPHSAEPNKTRNQGEACDSGIQGGYESGAFYITGELLIIVAKVARKGKEEKRNQSAPSK